MTRYLLSRPVTLTMILLSCVLFGLITLSKMDPAFSPDTGQPGLTVLVRYPGTDSRKIDSLITRKLEEAVSRVPGVARVISISSEGKSKIHIMYPYGTNLDLATMDILDAVAPVGAAFPRDVEKPVVLRYDPSDSPIFTVAISGKDLRLFRRFAEKKLKPKFERIKGVSEVIVAGGEMREILVSVDRYKSSARGVSLLSVVHALQYANYDVPGGIIPGISREVYTKTMGRFSNLKELFAVRVGGQKKPLFLNEIADIQKSSKPLENKSLAKGHEQVAIYVKKGGKASLLNVSASLRTVLEKTRMPQGARADIVYDASLFLSRSLRKLIEAGIIAAFVAALVLLLFLRSIAATSIISLSIPLSICVTFTGIGISGLPLDVMTLSGLAVGVGMMVDNSVVVLESIHNQLELSSDPCSAALQGTQRIGVAVFASTLTTVCVFLPILFLSPRMRLLFGNLAAAISISLFASLFIALTAVPVLMLYLFKKTKKKQQSTKKENIRFTQIKNKATVLIQLLLSTSLKKPLILVFLLIALSATAALFLPHIGREILAPLESDTLFAYVEFPSGTNLKRTTTITRKVSEIIRNYPFIRRTGTRIDKAHASITVKLHTEDSNIRPDRALSILSKRFKKYRTAFVHFASGASGAGGNVRTLTVNVTGDDLHQLKAWAKRGASVTGRLPDVREVVLLFKEGPPELVVRIDRQKAALLGLSSRDIGLEVRSAVFGPIATKFLEKGREIDIRVRFKEGNRIKPERLPEIPITVAEGKTIPLKAVATFSRSKGYGRIYRKNGRLSASFQIRYSGTDLGTIVKAVRKNLARLHPPRGIRFDPGKEAEELEKSGSSGLFAVAIAIILVFMVLASLYESFTLPFIVLMSVPPALGTAVITLFLTGISISIPVFLGFVMLAGLVVNNAILIVDEAKKRYEQKGEPAPEAAKSAVKHRVRPLLITTLTTVLGLTPLLFSSGGGSGLYKPMALTVLSGMLGSTGLSLFLIPALFVLFTTRKQHRCS